MSFFCIAIVSILSTLKANLANWAISYPQMQSGVKSALDVIKLTILAANELTTDNALTVDGIMNLKVKCANVAAMIGYVLSYASTQEAFLKKTAGGNNSTTGSNLSA